MIIPNKILWIQWNILSTNVLTKNNFYVFFFFLLELIWGIRFRFESSDAPVLCIVGRHTSLSSGVPARGASWECRNVMTARVSRTSVFFVVVFFLSFWIFWGGGGRGGTSSETTLACVAKLKHFYVWMSLRTQALDLRKRQNLLQKLFCWQIAIIFNLHPFSRFGGHC